MSGFSVEAGGSFGLASATLGGSTGFGIVNGSEGFAVSAGCGVGGGGMAGVGCTFANLDLANSALALAAASLSSAPLARVGGVVARLIGTPSLDVPLG